MANPINPYTGLPYKSKKNIPKDPEEQLQDYQAQRQRQRTLDDLKYSVLNKQARPQSSYNTNYSQNVQNNGQDLSGMSIDQLSAKLRQDMHNQYMSTMQPDQSNKFTKKTNWKNDGFELQKLQKLQQQVKPTIDNPYNDPRRVSDYDIEMVQKTPTKPISSGLMPDTPQYVDTMPNNLNIPNEDYENYLNRMKKARDVEGREGLINVTDNPLMKNLYSGIIDPLGYEAEKLYKDSWIGRTALQAGQTAGFKMINQDKVPLEKSDQGLIGNVSADMIGTILGLMTVKDGGGQSLLNATDDFGRMIGEKVAQKLPTAATKFGAAFNRIAPEMARGAADNAIGDAMLAIGQGKDLKTAAKDTAMSAGYGALFGGLTKGADEFIKQRRMDKIVNDPNFLYNYKQIGDGTVKETPGAKTPGAKGPDPDQLSIKGAKDKAKFNHLDDPLQLSRANRMKDKRRMIGGNDLAEDVVTSPGEFDTKYPTIKGHVTPIDDTTIDKEYFEMIPSYKVKRTPKTQETPKEPPKIEQKAAEPVKPLEIENKPEPLNNNLNTPSKAQEIAKTEQKPINRNNSIPDEDELLEAQSRANIGKKVNLERFGECEIIDEDNGQFTLKNKKGTQFKLGEAAFEKLMIYNKPAAAPKAADPPQIKPERQKVIDRLETARDKQEAAGFREKHPEIINELDNKIEGLKNGADYEVKDKTEELKTSIAYTGGQIPEINQNTKGKLIGTKGITWDEAKKSADNVKVKTETKDKKIETPPVKAVETPPVKAEPVKQENKTQDEYAKEIIEFYNKLGRKDISRKVGVVLELINNGELSNDYLTKVMEDVNGKINDVYIDKPAAKASKTDKKVIEDLNKRLQRANELYRNLGNAGYFEKNKNATLIEKETKIAEALKKQGEKHEAEEAERHKKRQELYDKTYKEYEDKIKADIENGMEFGKLVDKYADDEIEGLDVEGSYFALTIGNKLYEAKAAKEKGLTVEEYRKQYEEKQAEKSKEDDEFLKNYAYENSIKHTRHSQATIDNALARISEGKKLLKETLEELEINRNGLNYQIKEGGAKYRISGTDKETDLKKFTNEEIAKMKELAEKSNDILENHADMVNKAKASKKKKTDPPPIKKEAKKELTPPPIKKESPVKETPKEPDPEYLYKDLNLTNEDMDQINDYKGFDPDTDDADFPEYYLHDTEPESTEIWSKYQAKKKFEPPAITKRGNTKPSEAQEKYIERYVKRVFESGKYDETTQNAVQVFFNKKHGHLEAYTKLPNGNSGKYREIGAYVDTDGKAYSIGGPGAIHTDESINKKMDQLVPIDLNKYKKAAVPELTEKLTIRNVEELKEAINNGLNDILKQPGVTVQGSLVKSWFKGKTGVSFKIENGNVYYQDPSSTGPSWNKVEGNVSISVKPGNKTIETLEPKNTKPIETNEPPETKEVKPAEEVSVKNEEVPVKNEGLKNWLDNVKETDLDYKMLERSHSGVSFDPDKRAAEDQRSYVRHMKSVYEELEPLAKSDAQKEILLSELERYKEKYISMTNAIAGAGSRVMSTAITGPANFPVKANEKKFETYRNRVNERIEFSEKAIEGIKKKLKGAMTDQEVKSEYFKKLEKETLSSLADIHDIETGKSPGYSKSLATKNLSSRLKTAADNGHIEEFNKMLEVITQFQDKYKVTVFAKNNAIWSYAPKAAERIEAAPTGQKPHLKYKGAHTIENYDQDRLQIYFEKEGRPPENILKELHAHGWKYSKANNNAWQRKLTNSAKYDAKNLLNKFFEPEEAAPVKAPEPVIGDEIEYSNLTNGLNEDGVITKVNEDGTLEVKTELPIGDVTTTVKQSENGGYTEVKAPEPEVKAPDKKDKIKPPAIKKNTDPFRGLKPGESVNVKGNKAVIEKVDPESKTITYKVFDTIEGEVKKYTIKSSSFIGQLEKNNDGLIVKNNDTEIDSRKAYSNIDNIPKWDYSNMIKYHNAINKLKHNKYNNKLKKELDFVESMRKNTYTTKELQPGDRVVLMDRTDNSIYKVLKNDNINKVDFYIYGPNSRMKSFETYTNTGTVAEPKRWYKLELTIKQKEKLELLKTNLDNEIANIKNGNFSETSKEHFIKEAIDFYDREVEAIELNPEYTSVKKTFKAPDEIAPVKAAEPIKAADPEVKEKSALDKYEEENTEEYINAEIDKIRNYLSECRSTLRAGNELSEEQKLKLTKQFDYAMDKLTNLKSQNTFGFKNNLKNIVEEIKSVKRDTPSSIKQVNPLTGKALENIPNKEDLKFGDTNNHLFDRKVPSKFNKDTTNVLLRVDGNDKLKTVECISKGGLAIHPSEMDKSGNVSVTHQKSGILIGKFSNELKAKKFVNEALKRMDWDIDYEEIRKNVTPNLPLIRKLMEIAEQSKPAYTDELMNMDKRYKDKPLYINLSLNAGKGINDRMRGVEFKGYDRKSVKQDTNTVEPPPIKKAQRVTYEEEIKKNPPKEVKVDPKDRFTAAKPDTSKVEPKVKTSKVKTNTWKNSDFMSDQWVQDVVTDVNADYLEKPNQESFEKAVNMLTKDYDGTVAKLMNINKTSSSKEKPNLKNIFAEDQPTIIPMTAEDVAASMIITRDLINSGNSEKLADFLGSFRPNITNAGQVIQAMSMYKRLTPEGTLMRAAADVDKFMKDVVTDQPHKVNEANKTASDIAEQMKKVNTEVVDDVVKGVNDTLDDIITDPNETITINSIPVPIPTPIPTPGIGTVGGTGGSFGPGNNVTGGTVGAAGTDIGNGVDTGNGVSTGKGTGTGTGVGTGGTGVGTGGTGTGTGVGTGGTATDDTGKGTGTGTGKGTETGGTAATSSKTTTKAKDKVKPPPIKKEKAPKEPKPPKAPKEPKPPKEVTLEERLAKKIKSYTLSKPKQMEHDDKLLKSLFNVAKDEIDPLYMKQFTSPEEFVRHAIKFRDQYNEIWTKAKTLISEEYKDDEEIKALFEEYFNRKLVPVFYEKDLNKAIKLKMKENGINLSQLVKQHYIYSETAENYLVNTLTYGYDFTEEQANYLERYIRKEFKRLTAEKKEKILANMFKEKGPYKRSENGPIKRIMELSNLGVYNNEKYAKMVYEKKGLPVLTPDDISFINDKMIQYMAEKDPEMKEIWYGQIARRIGDKQATTTRGKALALLKIGLLGNLKTMITKNAGGNIALGIGENISDAPGGFYDYLISKKYDTLRTTTIPGLGNYKEQGKQLIDGMRRVIKDAKYNSNTNPTRGRYELPPGYAFKGSNPVSKTLNIVEKGINVGLSLGDRGFYQAGRESKIKQLEKLHKMKAENMPDYMKELAHETGLQRTYQNDSAFTDSMVSIKRGLNRIGKGYTPLGLGDLSMTYIKTMSNVVDKGVDYSGIGGLFEGLAELVKFNRDMKNNTVMDEGEIMKRQMWIVNKLGRGTVGATLLGAGVVGGILGLVTGGEDKNDKIKDIERSQGIQANSVKVGKTYHSIDWVDSVSTPVLIGADIAQKNKRGYSDYDLIVNTVENLVSKDLFYGLKRLMGQYGSDGLAGGLLQTLIEVPAMFVPTVFKQSAQMFDGTMRSTSGDNLLETTLNKVMNKIPYLSTKLDPQVDIWGNDKLINDGNNGVLDIMLNPSYRAKERENKAALVAMAVYNVNGNPDVLPKYAPYTRKITDYANEKHTIKLTDEERIEWQRIIGQGVANDFAKLFTDSTFKNADIDKQEEILKDIIDKWDDKALENLAKNRKIIKKYTYK